MADSDVTWTSRIGISVVVTSAEVVVTVMDKCPQDFRRHERLWGRAFPRPEGKSEQDCVEAALRALQAGQAGWIDLLNTPEGVLPVLW